MDPNSYEYQKDIQKNYRVRLKERLLYVMGNKCQICGYNKCDKALEFHHLNPEEKEFTISYNMNKSWDKVVTEVQKCALLCANCHRELHDGLIDETQLSSPFSQERADEISEKIRKIKVHQIHYCKRCGKEISGKGKTDYCSDCVAFARRKIERPSRDKLKEEIRTESFKELGRKYGVVDNTIRKWCKKYNLPSKKKEIEQISDEDWDKI